MSSLVKGVHTTASGYGVAAAEVSSDTLADETTKRGRVSAGLNPPMLPPTDDRIDQKERPAVWQALSSEWPPTAKTLFPQIFGSMESWLNTAHHGPDILLHHVHQL